MSKTNRQKSLEAILKHDNFNVGYYFKTESRFSQCCALGYALRVNGIKSKKEINFKYFELDEILGLNQLERFKITNFNDSRNIEQLKKYVKELLNETRK